MAKTKKPEPRVVRCHKCDAPAGEVTLRRDEQLRWVCARGCAAERNSALERMIRQLERAIARAQATQKGRKGGS